MGKRVLVLGFCMALFWVNAAAQAYLPPLRERFAPYGKRTPMPQNFYTQHLPFFCKQESRLQKHTGLNIYFRLGSKQYVDWLERKPNAIRQ